MTAGEMWLDKLSQMRTVFSNFVLALELGQGNLKEPLLELETIEPATLGAAVDSALGAPLAP